MDPRVRWGGKGHNVEWKVLFWDVVYSGGGVFLCVVYCGGGCVGETGGALLSKTAALMVGNATTIKPKRTVMGSSDGLSNCKKTGRNTRSFTSEGSVEKKSSSWGVTRNPSRSNKKNVKERSANVKRSVLAEGPKGVLSRWGPETWSDP